MSTITNHHTTNRLMGRRAITSVALAVGVGAAALGGSGAAAESAPAPPAFDLCAFRDLPLAVDIGPLLPPGAWVGEEMRDLLMGRVEVGTDCSFFDLPV